MPSNDHRLIADHKKVVETLRLYTNITLINTAGEPVDEYDIEYRIKGYSIAADGKISIGGRHRIKIKIPFGYPHFPPTIRPLSPVFHPEIDDHVVPIANYWEENKSLPDLILHIGNMICGKYHPSDNPINAEAARYYEEHHGSLPLDSLKRFDEEKKKVPREPVRLNILAPLLSILAICVLAGLIGGAGLFFYEKWRIGQAEDIFSKAEMYRGEREFVKAQEATEEALDNLPRFYLLQTARDSLQEKINAFQQSPSMVEGLRGNIRYGDEFISMERARQLDFLKDLTADAKKYEQLEELPAAVDSYTKALEYAAKNTLSTEGEEIRRDLAKIQLKLLVSASEKAHAEKNLEAAIEQHTTLLNFIKNNQKYLKESNKQEVKTRYLLLIDEIALYSREALEAENKNDYESSLKYHNMLIDLIGKTHSESSILNNTLLDSMQKVAYLTEKNNIERKREWLLENYREIFLINNPTILTSALRNPQAVFIKYDEENMVFDLSCLEKGSGSIVKLRIFYKYNPTTQEWSVYNGEIEPNS